MRGEVPKAKWNAKVSGLAAPRLRLREAVCRAPHFYLLARQDGVPTNSPTPAQRRPGAAAGTDKLDFIALEADAKELSCRRARSARAR